MSRPSDSTSFLAAFNSSRITPGVLTDHQLAPRYNSSSDGRSRPFTPVNPRDTRDADHASTLDAAGSRTGQLAPRCDGLPDTRDADHASAPDAPGSRMPSATVWRGGSC